jgi:hypothetical protein
MYPRTEYEMTQEDCDELLSSMKPVPMIMLHIGGGSSQQDNANRAWQRLGEKMGFVWDSVQPIAGKGMRFFTALPSETDEAKKERILREDKEKKRAHIQRLEQEIAKLQQDLADILATGE